MVSRPWLSGLGAHPYACEKRALSRQEAIDSHILCKFRILSDDDEMAMVVNLSSLRAVARFEDLPGPARWMELAPLEALSWIHDSTKASISLPVQELETLPDWFWSRKQAIAKGGNRLRAYAWNRATLIVAREFAFKSVLNLFSMSATSVFTATIFVFVFSIAAAAFGFRDANLFAIVWNAI